MEILYFASLREQLNTNREKLETGQNTLTVTSLKQLLAARGGEWQQAFSDNQDLLVAINQQMADDLSTIEANDEVAFFPPVTGG